MQMMRSGTDFKKRSMEPITQQTLIERTRNRRAAIARLKQCPLCDTVNTAEVLECVTCGWYGRFDYSADAILNGLKKLFRRSSS